MKHKQLTIRLSRTMVEVMSNRFKSLDINISNNKHLNQVYAYVLMRIYEKFYQEYPYLNAAGKNFKFRIEEWHAIFVATNHILASLEPSSYEHNQLLTLSMELDKKLKEFNHKLIPRQTNCDHLLESGRSAYNSVCGIALCSKCGDHDC